jgi:hypothetical protein
MNKQELKFIKFALNDDDYFTPYSNEEYLDYCYLKVDNKIINLDDIYDVFKEYLLED